MLAISPKKKGRYQDKPPKCTVWDEDFEKVTNWNGLFALLGQDIKKTQSKEIKGTFWSEMYLLFLRRFLWFKKGVIVVQVAEAWA